MAIQGEPPASDVITVTVLPPNPVEGVDAGAVAVGSFTATVAGPFTATIHWGDGAVTAGMVTGSGGQYFVTGDHVYTEEGDYSLSISVADDSGDAATASEKRSSEAEGVD